MRRSIVMALLGVLVGIAAGLACGPDTEDFFAQPFPCDPSEPAGACGRNREGQQMTCYPGAQMGMLNFCVDQCETPGETADHVCLDTKAKLRRCKPSDDGDRMRFPRGACGHPDLACLRTDLIFDEGVCVLGRVCTTDSECTDPQRSTCAATIVRSLVSSPFVKADHLNCVQAECKKRGAACAPGESCLPNLVAPQSKPIDLCVPHCDSNLNCPPNTFCYRKISDSAATPNVCVAGLPSFRCNSRTECLVGDCVEVVPTLKACSVPCFDDSTCRPLELPGSPQVCGRFEQEKRYCVSVDLFSGSNCKTDADCLGGRVCTRYSPYGTSVEDVGYCLMPCRDGRCENQAGVPHTCFDYLERPVCYPGKFGLYCSAPDACMTSLQCLRALEMDEDTDEFVTRPLCTIPCTTTADCAANHLGALARAYCEAGHCVKRRRGGRLCATDDQCESDKCAPSERPAEDGLSLRRCTHPPGGAR
jgi:hypothetical protein